MVIDPQDLPNYRHPQYTKMQGVMSLLLDVYEGLEDRKEAYLPKAEKEPDRAYKTRVNNSVFTNKLRPVIDANAGLLTAFELTSTPATVSARLDNLDGFGSDYKAFFREADKLALRDRHCFIFVDYPNPDREIVTFTDQLESQRTPNFSLIDRRNVLNWYDHFEDGKRILDFVTIEMVSIRPVGRFGVEQRSLYHQFKRVQLKDEAGNPLWRVEHIVWDLIQQQNVLTPIVVGSPEILDLPEIPLICYPHTAQPFGTEYPEFTKLARLNVKLFRKESALDEIEYRVNVPTVWRKHPGDVPDQLPPITFGSTWVIEIPEGGEVGVLEIQGNGVAALQLSIDKLKTEIESESMAFLSGSQVQRTATESFLSSSQVQAGLTGMARDKSSAIKRCFDYWCAYTGEANTVEVSMDHSLLEMPLDAQEMGQLLALWNADAITHETLLDLLKMGRQLPPDFDAAEEIRKIEASKAQEMATRPVDPLAIANNTGGLFNGMANN